MRIALGSDHAGYDLKELLGDHLTSRGHQVEDLGTSDATTSVDYPDFGAAVGRAVATGAADLGVCVCGTGIGLSIAANKISGVRAAVISDVTTARLTRQHNHANVVCLGSRVVGPVTATDALDAFLDAVPEEGRHLGRIAKLAALDDELATPIETTEVQAT